MLKKIGLGLLLISPNAFTQVHAEYTGKIESMYIHERDAAPYFGIELKGEMNNNPCGSAKKFFIIKPSEINDHQYTMLMAALISGKDVKISNQDTTEAQRCHGAYPRFNMVQIFE